MLREVGDARQQLADPRLDEHSDDGAALPAAVQRRERQIALGVRRGVRRGGAIDSGSDGAVVTQQA